jgi:putative cardiolipin synthase
VRELSRVFDTYWNSEQVFPSATWPRRPRRPRRRGSASTSWCATPDAQVEERPRDVLGATPVAQQLDAGALSQAYAAARVFADTPDKVAGRNDGIAHRDRADAGLFAAARDEVSIASPYFIPGSAACAMMRAVGATQENGRITLITNSLGSTDEPLVHASYARYRLDMLKAGVRIYELTPVAQPALRTARQLRPLDRRLHAKAATIDRRTVFIGSMNLDARSARINTEVGLASRAPSSRAPSRTLSREGLATGAYRLRLSADGEHVEWVEIDPTARRSCTPTSRAGMVLRFKQWLLAPFVSDELL